MDNKRENCSFREGTGWIYIVTVLALLPMLLMRDYTPPNELRYLSIVDEAIRDGSIWCFHNHGEIYADKPPLYFWLMMCARRLFGGHIAIVYGLFSVVPMLIVGRVMDDMAKSVMTLRQRQTALLMLFTCAVFITMGATLRMDMLMTLWIVLAMRQVWLMTEHGYMHSAKRYRHGALLGLYVFLAIFTKGPYGFIFPFLASLVWLLAEKRGRQFFRIWNLMAWGVIIVGCSLWFRAVWVEGGEPYLDNLLFHQTIDRAHNAFHHRRPVWFYLVAIWYVMAPWSLLMLYHAVKARKDVMRGAFRRMMCLTAIVMLAVLSCVSSKLQIYLLPAIPFAIYWCASMSLPLKGEKIVRGTAYVLLGIIAVGGLAIPWINPYFGYGTAARRAKALHPDEVLIDTSISRGENIDAYFDGTPCRMVNLTDSTFELPHGAVLLVKDNPTQIRLIYEQNR